MTAKDPAVIKKWVDQNYRQHSPYVETGRDGLEHLVASLRDDYSYELVRIFSDGDLVVLHGIHRNWLNGVLTGGEAVVGIDMFRVANDQIQEHWDASVPVMRISASGRTQLDGPVTIEHPDRTEQSRQTGKAFVHTVLVDKQFHRLPEFISKHGLSQHIPEIADGIANLEEALPVSNKEYVAIRKVVAEGEFVAVQSEGMVNGQTHTFWDLFRIDSHGKIAEQWQVAAVFPDIVPHDNGPF
nr:nuclear transport factor 2 family protein [Burkholderia metallica]